MPVGVELVALLAGVESLETVLLQGSHENRLGHPESVVERLQLYVAAIELLLGNNGKSTIEVIDAVEQVFGESLQGKVLCCLHLSLGLLLEIAVLGDGALPLVLLRRVSASHPLPLFVASVSSRVDLPSRL